MRNLCVWGEVAVVGVAGVGGRVRAIECVPESGVRVGLNEQGRGGSVEETLGTICTRWWRGLVKVILACARAGSGSRARPFPRVCGRTVASSPAGETGESGAYVRGRGR